MNDGQLKKVKQTDSNVKKQTLQNRYRNCYRNYCERNLHFTNSLRPKRPGCQVVTAARVMRRVWQWAAWNCHVLHKSLLSVTHLKVRWRSNRSWIAASMTSVVSLHTWVANTSHRKIWLKEHIKKSKFWLKGSDVYVTKLLRNTEIHKMSYLHLINAIPITKSS